MRPENVHCPQCGSSIDENDSVEVGGRNWCSMLCWQKMMDGVPAAAHVAEKKAAGIYEKFNVERTDGKSAPGEKHHACKYFVLDLNHDPFSVPAIAAYAWVCRANGYVTLAEELEAIADMKKQHDPTVNAALTQAKLTHMRGEPLTPEVLRHIVDAMDRGANPCLDEADGGEMLVRDLIEEIYRLRKAKS